MMERLNRWMEDKFLPVAAKVSGWRYMIATRNAFFSAIPFILVGSIFLIVGFLAIPGWDKMIAPYLNNLLDGFNMTMGLLAIWVALAYGYSLSQTYGLNPLVGAMSSLMGFFVIAARFKDGNLSGAYLGGAGIFAAILVSTFAVEVYRFFTVRNITIKLPDSVPPMIAASFGAILPLFFELIALEIMATWLHWDIPALIMKAFTPLVAAGDSYVAMVGLSILVALLFYLGIQGWSVVLGIIGPIEMANIQANAAAHAAGQALPHVLVEPFFSAFLSLGGTTTAAALVIWLFFAKSKQLRQAARLSAVPVLLVNVNEPIMFSAPTVLNPYLFFPVVFTYPVLATTTWLAMHFGWVTKPYVYIPFSMPHPFAAWITTGGDWRSIILVVVNFALALAIYYPFVRQYDRITYAEETKGAAA